MQYALIFNDKTNKLWLLHTLSFTFHAMGTQIQSMFGRFMKGIKTMHFHGRCVPQSLVTFYFDVPDPNSIFSLIGRNTF